MKRWLGILTALVVAETILIIIYCCSKLQVDSNTPNVLISALGVLVTFVVAWQIWQTIDAKNTILDLRTDMNKLQIECSSMTDGNRNAILGWYKCHFADILVKDKAYDTAYNELLSALNLLLNSSLSYDDDLFQDCFWTMEDCLESLEGQGSENAAKRFCQDFQNHENEYLKIINILNKNGSLIRNIKSEIKRVRGIRLDVVKKLKAKYNI